VLSRVVCKQEGIIYVCVLRQNVFSVNRIIRDESFSSAINILKWEVGQTCRLK